MCAVRFVNIFNNATRVRGKQTKETEKDKIINTEKKENSSLEI